MGKQDGKYETKIVVPQGTDDAKPEELKAPKDDQCALCKSANTMTSIYPEAGTKVVRCQEQACGYVATYDKGGMLI